MEAPGTKKILLRIPMYFKKSHVGGATIWKENALNFTKITRRLHFFRNPRILAEKQVQKLRKKFAQKIADKSVTKFLNIPHFKKQ
jgi:hypothetical protein